ncbi:MAG: hypothetical protein D6675_07375 [Gemmatimonadetes bacterium]|nr:MAG: hypothetical protein D6675_07375 [Gemmatimonadota bacterium]
MDANLDQWIKNHEAELAKYPGEWVTIKLDLDEVVSHSKNMNEAIDAFTKRFSGQEALIHLVPAGDEEYFTL